MSSNILAYRLLKFVNLEDTQEQLIRVTVKELTILLKMCITKGINLQAEDTTKQQQQQQ